MFVTKLHFEGTPPPRWDGTIHILTMTDPKWRDTDSPYSAFLATGCCDEF